MVPLGRQYLDLTSVDPPIVWYAYLTDYSFIINSKTFYSVLVVLTMIDIEHTTVSMDAFFPALG